MGFAQSSLQILDLDLEPLHHRTRSRPATLGKPLLAALEKLALPIRDRLLRDLRPPSSLRDSHLSRDDRNDEPELVFNRDNKRASHRSLLLMRSPKITDLPDFMKQNTQNQREWLLQYP